ncbi:host cell division inhibitor Icd-like protein [Escherichia coli]|nr:host cell division inhibitor Icd-like protein [Escherichia coli]EER6203556.1 host cell division inhibitor Icd-like protein [Escherichia coli]EES9052811.1 host cell division inhibitor Icd-like protein [Escherichia coli]EEV2073474.1 host cell division inhibitor Icd-like protein [Escherichia coli]EEW4835122.1 host cell division inhibitor Icd-like protein [Escherichia coli]
MDERTRTRSARNDRLTYIGQMMNIKKAAPKWSHLSEQLTRCAVCVNNHKPGHDNRDQAGGQLSCLLGPYCAAIFIRSEREYFFRNSSRTKAHGANLSDSCSSAIFSCSLFVFCDGVLVDSLLVIVCTCKAMRRSSSRHGADVFYPLGSIPRCCNSFRSTRLIQVAKEVSPSAFAASSSCALNSSGSRIWYGGDRFSNGVDMVITLNYYSYMVITIVLTVIQKTTPRSGGSHTGRLTKPLIEVTIMAIKEHSLLFIHTQTPRKRNNPFHGSVLCTHPGGRFLPDLSRRGYLSTKSSRANFSGGTKRGAGGGIFVLVSSSSSLAQASDCLCRMISSSCVCVSCIGDSVLLVMILPCKAMRRSTSHHGADGDYSGSLVLRRWSSSRATVTSCPISSAALIPSFSTCASASCEEIRGFSPLPSAWRRAISPRMAVTMNPALLSPSSFTDSMPSITSCGIRAVSDCDFAFFEPVAICNPLNESVRQYTHKKSYIKALTCKPPINKVTYTLLMQGAETTKPRTVGAVTGLLTTNDSKIIEAAMRNYTIHPQGRDSYNLNKYIWRFIALSTAQPRVIHIVATSEQEARQQSPAGCVMVFAARIRQEVCHVQ